MQGAVFLRKTALKGINSPYSNSLSGVSRRPAQHNEATRQIATAVDSSVIAGERQTRCKSFGAPPPAWRSPDCIDSLE